MNGKRYIGFAFIAVLAIQLIFLVAQIPGTYATQKSLPIAFVNEDAGPMGETLFKTIEKQMAANQGNKESAIEWIQLKNEATMKEKMKGKEIYGAILIPKEFSAQYSSLQSNEPTTALINLYVNEGKNANVATVVNQTLQRLVAQMNAAMSEQILSVVEQQNMPLTVSQAKILTTPIQSITIALHPTRDLSNAPTAFFQPIWLATYATVLIWMLGKSRVFLSLKEQLLFRSLQIAIASILGAFSGYMIVWLASSILDFHFESYWTLASFLAIASICFMLLFLGLSQWIGYGSVAIIILLMFFGAPLIQLAPEMMPTFYAEWVYPWLPMHFMIDGIKDILFYPSNVWNYNTMILLLFAAFGILLTLLKGSAKKVTSKVDENESTLDI